MANCLRGALPPVDLRAVCQRHTKNGDTTTHSCQCALSTCIFRDSPQNLARITTQVCSYLLGTSHGDEKEEGEWVNG